MKKATKEWAKKELINYLDEKNITLVRSGYGSSDRMGFATKPKDFTHHNNSAIDKHVERSFDPSYEDRIGEAYLYFLYNKRKGNEKEFIDFLKYKCPTMRALKSNENSSVYVNSEIGVEYQKYQSLVVSILKNDQDMLFDYIGNLKYLTKEKETVFKLIKKVFNEEKQNTLIEMYLNSELMKSADFESSLYSLIEDLGLEDKYKEMFPNLKGGKRVFELNNFPSKTTNAFTIDFLECDLVKHRLADKTYNAILSDIGNMTVLSEIPELRTDILQSVDILKGKRVIFLGDELNLEYIKVAVNEYMTIVLTEQNDSSDAYRITNLAGVFRKGMSADEKTDALRGFKQRVGKVYLNQVLERDLNKVCDTKKQTAKI